MNTYVFIFRFDSRDLDLYENFYPGEIKFINTCVLNACSEIHPKTY